MREKEGNTCGRQDVCEREREREIESRHCGPSGFRIS